MFILFNVKHVWWGENNSYFSVFPPKPLLDLAMLFGAHTSGNPLGLRRLNKMLLFSKSLAWYTLSSNPGGENYFFFPFRRCRFSLSEKNPCNTAPDNWSNFDAKSYQMYEHTEEARYILACGKAKWQYFSFNILTILLINQKVARIVLS